MESAISKSTQSLTTAEDMRNETQLMMQPYANWEEYLTPAPLSIAILGELVFISSSTDSLSIKIPLKMAINSSNTLIPFALASCKYVVTLAGGHLMRPIRAWIRFASILPKYQLT